MVSGKKITLANVDGKIYAIDDACTHAQCSLGSDGSLAGNVIMCGCHGAQFDVMSGKVLSGPALSDVSTYETKIEKGYIYIAL